MFRSYTVTSLFLQLPYSASSFPSASSPFHLLAYCFFLFFFFCMQPECRFNFFCCSRREEEMLSIRKHIRTISYSRFLFTYFVVAVRRCCFFFLSFFFPSQSATETVLNVLPVPGACHFPILQKGLLPPFLP